MSIQRTNILPRLQPTSHTIPKSLLTLLLLISTLTYQTQSLVLQKGKNITEQMEVGIRKCIKDSALNCSLTDRSCFSQIVGMKIQNLYGKSWNVHLLEKATTLIKGMQYSHDRWISLINQGQPAFSYFIFKPIDCSKPLLGRTMKMPTSHAIAQYSNGGFEQQKQYWGNSMTDSLKTKLKTLMTQAFKASENIQQNAQYIQNKMGPGRWQVIIWNTPSFDYMNTCMYASYFGMVVGVARGAQIWSYYAGRMSLI